MMKAMLNSNLPSCQSSRAQSVEMALCDEDASSPPNQLGAAYEDPITRGVARSKIKGAENSPSDSSRPIPPDQIAAEQEYNPSAVFKRVDQFNHPTPVEYWNYRYAATLPHGQPRYTLLIKRIKKILLQRLLSPLQLHPLHHQHHLDLTRLAQLLTWMIQ